MKKALKRSLSLLLAITIIFGSMYVGLGEVDFGVQTKALFGETSGTTGDCTFLLENGVLTISGTGSMQNYMGDEAPWYYYNSSISKVIIEDGVTNIGNSSFYFCENLDDIIIPDSVTRIGSNAFYYCESLTNIILPESIKYIAANAFYGSGLYTDSANWVNNVLYVGDCLIKAETSLSGTYKVKSGTRLIASSAFRECTKLTAVVISDGVTHIGSYAFGGCTNLTSITIPNSVIQINDRAFYDCKNLDSVYIFDIAAWCNIDFYDDYSNPISYSEKLYMNNQLVENLVIPEGVTHINAYAFYNHKNIPTITIPQSVTFIGENAFSGHYEFTSVNITNITAWCNIEFENLGSNPLFNSQLCLNGELVTDVIVPDGATRIGAYAFYGCKNLESVTLPDSITYIGKYAFQDSRYYNDSSNWDNSVLYINNHLIAAKNTLSGSYEIKSGTKTISPQAFINCSIQSITVPDSVVMIGENAFSGCSSLSGVYVESITAWCNINFGNEKSNPLIYGQDLYLNGSLVTSLDITEGTTNICDYAFYNCDSLTSVTIPASMLSIGTNAFAECSNIKTVYYLGDLDNWEMITIEAGNEPLMDITVTHRCVYSDYWTVTKPVTCTSNGLWTKSCKGCDNVITKTVVATGHDYCNWVVTKKPTCVQYGIAQRTCYKCNNTEVATESYTEDILVDSSLYPESKHNYYNYVSETYDFSYKGAKSLTLNFSSLTQTESNYDYIYIYDATGAQYGKYSGTTLAGQSITLQGDSFTIKLTSDGSVNKYGFAFDSIVAKMCLDIIVPLGHSNPEKWTVDSEANCTESGSKHKECKVCGEKTIEIIPATGHQNTTWITEQEPTCTVDGYKDKWCLDCAELINTQVIPATGHSGGEWIVDIAPTCTEGGSRHQTCSVCGLVVSEETPANGHSYSTEWTIDVAPTCTEDGSKSHHCTACGDKVDVSVIESLGHIYSTEWTIDVVPTCTEEGSKSHHCTACGDKADVSVIESLGHIYSTDWTIDLVPTCTEEGSKSHHCTGCEDSVSDVTVIEPLGHDFKVVSVVDEHPHTTTFDCSRCPETKEEESYSEKCEVCNFSYTDNGDGTCKITEYIGNSDSFVIPATIYGKTVTTTNTGAFKNNTTLTSVRIENGVQGLGALAFLGCKSLSKVVIPESVTSIGENAFYNCASDFTIYCYRDTYAMQYAIDNSLNYVIMDIGETEDSIIDYENKLIFLSKDCVTSLDDILYVPSSSMAFAEASHISGDNVFLGTGSIVTVFDGNDISSEYTVIVEGDTNGDSVCDVLDTLSVAKVSNGHTSFDGAYAIAADSNADDIIDINDYQDIVNKAVS